MEHGFRSWVVYQRIALRMPYDSIIETLTDHFNETTKSIVFCLGFMT